MLPARGPPFRNGCSFAGVGSFTLSRVQKETALKERRRGGREAIFKYGKGWEHVLCISSAEQMSAQEEEDLEQLAPPSVPQLPQSITLPVSREDPHKPAAAGEVRQGEEGWIWRVLSSRSPQDSVLTDHAGDGPEVPPTPGPSIPRPAPQNPTSTSTSTQDRSRSPDHVWHPREWGRVSNPARPLPRLGRAWALCQVL